MLRRRIAFASTLLVVRGMAAANASPPVLMYVDPVAGADTSDCTVPAAPCRTLTQAIRSTIQPSPGYEILAAPGIYFQEFLPLAIPNGVLVRAVFGAGVTTIQDRTPDGAPTIEIMADRALTALTGIDGFTIDGSGLAQNAYGLWVASIADVNAGAAPVVRNCTFVHYAEAAILLATYGACPDPSCSSTYLQAIVERNRIDGTPSGTGAATRRGIAVYTFSDDARTVPVNQSLLRNNFIHGCDVGVELRTWPTSDSMPQPPTGLGQILAELRHNTILDSIDAGVLLVADDAIATQVVPSIRIPFANNIVAGSGGFGLEESVGDGASRYLSADAGTLVANDFSGNARGGYFDADTGTTASTAVELDTIPDLGGAGSQNRSDDPLVDRATGALGVLSPCRDTGSSAISATALDDIDEEARPIGSAPDIGADEILPLLRGFFSSVAPVFPPKSVVFLPALPEYLSAPRSSFVDPDVRGILTYEAWPLVVYQIARDGDVLLLTKESPTVRIAY